MSFLRVEKKVSGTYLRVVETYRGGKAVRHRTLYSLGKVEDYTTEELAAMGYKLLSLSGAEVDTEAGEMEELGRYNYGYPMLVKHLIGKFGLDVMIDRYSRYHKLSYNLSDCLTLLLCDRFRLPCSKLQSHKSQGDYWGLPLLDLQHLYRSLNYFFKHKEAIKEHLFRQQRRLLGVELDMVFYDVTTFYFDSEAEKEGHLRQMGFGKDGKIGKTQVLFGLLTDRRGNPVGYEVYSGDTYEGHTFSKALETLRLKYKLRRVIVVADSGMMNRANIALFDAVDAEREASFEFIVADRLKNLKEAAQTYLCDLKHYDQVIVWEEDGTMIPIRYAVLEYEGRLLLGTYSEKRAKKDAHERQKKIEKGLELLKKPALVRKKAKRFYLANTAGEEKYQLDQQKIDADARFDGFLVLATNVLELTPPQIIERYKDLYHVEHSFRSFKSFLETRPMFHWTDERIEGHLCVCYIAQCLLAFLKTKLKEENIAVTENTIRRAFSDLQLSKIKIPIQEESFFLCSRVEDNTRKILQTLSMPVLSGKISAKKLASKLF